MGDGRRRHIVCLGGDDNASTPASTEASVPEDLTRIRASLGTGGFAEPEVVQAAADACSSETEFAPAARQIGKPSEPVALADAAAGEQPSEAARPRRLTIDSEALLPPADSVGRQKSTRSSPHCELEVGRFMSGRISFRESVQSEDDTFSTMSRPSRMFGMRSEGVGSDFGTRPPARASSRRGSTVSEASKEVRPTDSMLARASRLLAAAAYTSRNSSLSEASFGGKSVLTRMSTRQLLAKRLKQGSGQTLELSKDALDLVSFRDARGLLRGSRLATVLEWGGKVFLDSTGSAATYALSEPVENLDAFISHNWCVPRFKKYLTLVVHFNLWPAFLIMVLCSAVFATLEVMGQMPDSLLVEGEPGWNFQECILNRLLCTPIYVAAILWCRYPGRLFGWRGPVLFLDKTCIHQVDRDLQALGIKKLGAFLRSSSSMVIIYTDVYLQRLWTVYEIASCLALHPLEIMRVVPTSVPVALFSGLIIVYAANVADVLLALWVPGAKRELSQRIPILAVCYPLVWALRKTAREKEEMRSRLAGFLVAECSCSQEGDRETVYSNIAALMKATEAIPRTAPTGLALATFNQLVREKVPDALVASVGQVGLRYKYMVVVSANAVLPQFADALAGVTTGLATREVCVQALCYVTIIFGLFPLWIMVMARLGSCCLHLRDWRDGTFVVGVALLVACFLVLGVFLWDALVGWSYRSDVGVTILALFACLTFLMTRFAYRGVPLRFKEEEVN